MSSQDPRQTQPLRQNLAIIALMLRQGIAGVLALFLTAGLGAAVGLALGALLGFMIYNILTVATDVVAPLTGKIALGHYHNYTNLAGFLMVIVGAVVGIIVAFCALPNIAPYGPFIDDGSSDFETRLTGLGTRKHSLEKRQTVRLFKTFIKQGLLAFAVVGLLGGVLTSLVPIHDTLFWLVLIGGLVIPSLLVAIQSPLIVTFRWALTLIAFTLGGAAVPLLTGYGSFLSGIAGALALMEALFFSPFNHTLNTVAFGKATEKEKQAWSHACFHLLDMNVRHIVSAQAPLLSGSDPMFHTGSYHDKTRQALFDKSIAVLLSQQSRFTITEEDANTLTRSDLFSLGSGHERLAAETYLAPYRPLAATLS